MGASAYYRFEGNRQVDVNDLSLRKWLITGQISSNFPIMYLGVVLFVYNTGLFKKSFLLCCNWPHMCESAESYKCCLQLRANRELKRLQNSAGYLLGARVLSIVLWICELKFEGRVLMKSISEGQLNEPDRYRRSISAAS